MISPKLTRIVRRNATPVGLACLLGFLCFTVYYLAQYEGDVVILKKREVETQENTAKGVDTVSLPFHPFDNECRFPVPNFHAKDHVVIIEGGLRNAITNKGKDEFKEVYTQEGPENVRFWVNADVFFIRCIDKTGNVVWQKPFPGMRDLDKKKNEITLVSDYSTIDNYGRRKDIPTPTTPNRYSVDILGFDSTARTMFYRHMPRTVDIMEKAGYISLYGYNKVGDNSMVNLVPILAGDLKEALEEPKLDNSSDINSEWLIPTTRQLDPTLIPFLWKMMKGFGCKSMLNEDIGTKLRGLFSYPSNEFKPGFTKQPTDHYYRAYYLAVYEKWAYAQCTNGDQIQKEFVALWHKFAHKYRDICHFGFTFVPSLTHQSPVTIETIDEHLSSKLENLLSNGVLDNSVSIIMGDHGNRMGDVQYSYSGRIEERMPLMSIRLPPSFIEKYPELYQNLLENRYKLTSNFDVHQMLKDFVLMDFGKPKRENERGISLLQKIPEKRSCFDASIPENFCTCLVDRSMLTEVDRNVYLKDLAHRKKKSMETVQMWLKEHNLASCFGAGNLTLGEPFETLGLNIFAVQGLRSKANMTITEAARNKQANYKFLHHEFSVSGRSRKHSHPLKMVFRVDIFIETDDYSVVFEPSMRKTPVNCDYKSLFDVCECLAKV